MTVTVYTLPDCSACTATTKYMDRQGVSYSKALLTEHPDVLAWAQELGYSEAPVVVVEGPDVKLSWSGFRPANIKGLLKHERTD